MDTTIGGRDAFNKAQAAARSDAVAATIRRAVPEAAGLTGLDYGCGPGHIGVRLAGHFGKIILADADPAALAQAATAAAGLANTTTMVLDLARQTPPEGLRADVVFSSLAWHHVTDLDRLLDALPVVAPGGRLIVAEMDPDDGAYHAEVPGFIGVDGFDRAELAARLARHDYTDIDTAPLGSWSKWILGELVTVSLFLLQANLPRH